jgi:hypothetical protein
MPVGDLESNERGTGARFNDGKPPMELIPLALLPQHFSSKLAGVIAWLVAFTKDRNPGHLSTAYNMASDMTSGELQLLELEARVFGYGAKEYAAWNWTKGMPWSVPVACIIRHLMAIERGEENDPESGLPHVGHIACNLRMLMHYVDHYPEGDDLFPPRTVKHVAAWCGTPIDQLSPEEKAEFDSWRETEGAALFSPRKED